LTQPTPSKQKSEPTREALISSALHLFGRQGFDGTSTREISARAGANIAAIAYHFGGKDGLRLACGKAIAAQMTKVLQNGVKTPFASKDQAIRHLENTIEAMARFLLLGAQAEDILSFMLREINEDGPVLDGIYQTMIEPKHRELCAAWGGATGADPESEDTRLAVFSMIGQLLYFRIGKPVILRRMEWETIQRQDADRIVRLLKRNLHAALAAASEE